jgi:hypothetical protein
MVAGACCLSICQACAWLEVQNNYMSWALGNRSRRSLAWSILHGGMTRDLR